MKFYTIKPEVAGDFGEHTVGDLNARPPRIEHLHYVFDNWLGNDIVESVCIYLCTTRLKVAIMASNLRGCQFAEAKQSNSPQFRELHREGYLSPELPPNKRRPLFVWLQPIGTPGADDFGFDPRVRCMIVSEAARSLLE